MSRRPISDICPVKYVVVKGCICPTLGSVLGPVDTYHKRPDTKTLYHCYTFTHSLIQH